MIEPASKIKLLILDIDGVLTDGLLYYGAQGEVLKAFNVRDGLGIRLLLEHDIQVAIITGRNSEIVATRAKELGISHVYQGRTNKLAALDELLQKLKIDLSEIAYMGDDIIDLPILTRVGLPASPKDGHTLIREHVAFISQYNGGRGAVRELADLILSAQNKLENILAKTMSKGEILSNKAKSSC